MLDAATVDDAALRLEEALSTRTQLRQFSRLWPAMTIDDAYAIQRRWMGLRAAQGHVVRGHKIGLTSRAMQQSSQIDEPDYGTLLDDMFYREGGDISLSAFIVPRVEVELAFLLSRPLQGPDCSLFDVLSATEYVTPALEIIDARVEALDRESGAARRVVDTISDNAASAGVVLGGRPVRPGDIDLRWVAALLYRNGVIEESGVAAAVLNHPAHGVAWLANKLAPHGVALGAGEVILAGSFTRPIAARAGDTFHADFGALGSIACRFTPPA